MPTDFDVIRSKLLDIKRISERNVLTFDQNDTEVLATKWARMAVAMEKVEEEIARMETLTYTHHIDIIV